MKRPLSADRWVGLIESGVNEWAKEGESKRGRKRRDKILNAHLISSVWTLFEIKLKSVGFFLWISILRGYSKGKKQLKHGVSFASIKECGSVWSPKVNTKLDVQPWCSNHSISTDLLQEHQWSTASFVFQTTKNVWSWAWIKYDREKDPTTCHGDSRLFLSLDRRFLQLIGWTVMSNET